jgi:golgin subfamily A member 4
LPTLHLHVFHTQAAVNSASANNSSGEDVSATNTSSSGNENYFSLTEDETPHNSPMKTISLNNSSTPSSSKPVSVELHSPSAPNTSSVSYSSLNNGISFQRQRRNSNSSMASDVSFRLPHYESQPVRIYYLHYN